MNDSIDEMLDIFGKEETISNPSQNKVLPTKDSLTIREDYVAYFCEKCKTSTFYSSDKKCGRCGYLLGNAIR